MTRSSLGSHNLQHSMVVAVVSMGMVQVAIDEIVRMIPVGNGFVTAIGAMHMAFGVSANVMIAGAFIRMRGIHFHHMVFLLSAFLMHQVAAFEIIRVPVMFDRRVPATGAMLMSF